MMIKLLRERRSIRVYQKRKIEPEKVNILKEALLRSPSSRNYKPWEFIFVDDAVLLGKLSHAKQHGSSFLENAPLGIIISGDEGISDVWIEDCSIATIICQLTAQSLGLGSCWIQIRKRMHDWQTSSEEYVRKIVNIPQALSVQSIIAVGYPAESKEEIPSSQLDKKNIYENYYEN